MFFIAPACFLLLLFFNSFIVFWKRENFMFVQETLRPQVWRMFGHILLWHFTSTKASISSDGIDEISEWQICLSMSSLLSLVQILLWNLWGVHFGWCDHALYM